MQKNCGQLSRNLKVRNLNWTANKTFFIADEVTEMAWSQKLPAHYADINKNLKFRRKTHEYHKLYESWLSGNLY